MARSFHTIANRIAALAMKLLFGSVAHIHVLRVENANVSGGVLLASNHISHFDPFILSAVIRRKIDWMTMAEFFPIPVAGMFLRAVDAFPADRDRANRATIRTAIERLRNGRVVGLFPEGGIRDGQNSILQGAPARSGVSVLADIADVAVLPCVILGSDRLYNKKRWLPFRRTPIWIAFGEVIPKPHELPKSALRHRIEQELASTINKLYAELRSVFSLSDDDLPHPPKLRMLQ
jgi:1-acyl-sn-glycerol-3-phosphate acyltransferase